MKDGMRFGTAFNQLNGFKRIARKPWQEKLPCMLPEGNSLVKITYKRRHSGCMGYGALGPPTTCSKKIGC